MRKTLLIILPLLLSVGLSQQEYDLNSIEEKNGVWFQKDGEEVVSGKVFQMVGSKKVPLGKMKEGKKDGLWTDWYENGQKEKEGTYKDGKPDGLWTMWYENGQKKSEGTYEDGFWWEF